MFTFNLKYFLLAIGLFFIELFIGLYVHDHIIRPYIGDLLVVILLYCMAKSVISSKVLPTAMGVLIFAYAVEISQYFDMVNLLGLGKYKIARIIIGTTFSWSDMLLYTIGIAIVLLIEKKKTIFKLA